MNKPTNTFSRRGFLKTSTIFSIGTIAAANSLASVLLKKGNIAIVSDDIAKNIPPGWAVGQLKSALERQGSAVRLVSRISEVKPDEFCIVASGMNSAISKGIFKQNKITTPIEAESLCLVQTKIKECQAPVLLAAGTDNLGLVYALTELADRVTCQKTGSSTLQFDEPLIERPASRTRSILRNFSSELEDKPWFYDKNYWLSYLDMLIYSRVNRLNFSTGMGYNSANGVSDGYLLFPYPFFVTIPGYNVTARGLSEDERKRNYEMLKFIGEETSKRGLQLQFGVWTLAYIWDKSPKATYQIDGLTDKTHANYCRDALATILREVPGITGITFRVHSESGIPKGAEDFWKTQFSAIANCGRRVEIDMHAKNMEAETLQAALNTKQPVVVSPKFCGEHLGLPCHTASIRELEMTGTNELVDTGKGLLDGNRKFTRYGYADMLSENREWDVIFRIWPGTQRFLLNADPALFAGYGRTASFCGAAGFELSEPLHFKGRRGKGVEGGRCGYADASLNPKYDFEKYAYTYRLWGRLGYNPEAKPEIWRRAFSSEFGNAAMAIETALGQVTRVLPLFYHAHQVSANCELYLPELYTNTFMADETKASDNADTQKPKLFGNISPADPQLFQSPNEFAEVLLSGTVTGKYSPVEVAQWLENIAAKSSENIRSAKAQLGLEATRPNFRRIEEDVLILVGLAQFFAAKLRSGVVWHVYHLSGDRKAGEKAIDLYLAGRNIWAKMAEGAKSVYKTKISYGPNGHWIDRIPSFDEDIADLRKRLEIPLNAANKIDTSAIEKAIKISTSRPIRPNIEAKHQPEISFQSGKPHPVGIEFKGNQHSVKLYYRHVNQAERWQTVELKQNGKIFEGEIPADYTSKRFPLQYYFEVQTSQTEATLYPPMDEDLSNLLYFVVRRQKN